MTWDVWVTKYSYRTSSNSPSFVLLAGNFTAPSSNSHLPYIYSRLVSARPSKLLAFTPASAPRHLALVRRYYPTQGTQSPSLLPFAAIADLQLLYSHQRSDPASLPFLPRGFATTIVICCCRYYFTARLGFTIISSFESVPIHHSGLSSNLALMISLHHDKQSAQPHPLPRLWRPQYSSV